jgi:hypothetical protein
MALAGRKTSAKVCRTNRSARGRDGIIIKGFPHFLFFLLFRPERRVRCCGRRGAPDSGCQKSHWWTSGVSNAICGSLALSIFLPPLFPILIFRPQIIFLCAEGVRLHPRLSSAFSLIPHNLMVFILNFHTLSWTVIGGEVT